MQHVQVGCSAVCRVARARHTTQKQGVAVFEGLGLHPSVFLLGQGEREKGGE